MLFRGLPVQLKCRISCYYKKRYRGRWFDKKNTVSESLKEVRLKQASGLIGRDKHDASDVARPAFRPVSRRSWRGCMSCC